MCGILGVVSSKSIYKEESLFQSSLETMSHRGPNDCGLKFFSGAYGQLALGHTRLSIIDLSSSGNQPFCSADGRFAIVFNGEIYNYKELRIELENLGCEFSTQSDTEVLLQAWIFWGSSCLKKLIGMFAFSIYDELENTLTCVRDPFGIKPFFYYCNDDDFIFSSEIPTLKSLLPIKPSLNVQSAYDYLVFGQYDVAGRTIYSGVSQLLPGNYIIYNLKKNKIDNLVQWWKPSINEKKCSYDDAVKQVREEFLKNVHLHLRSDVSLGAALSGGIDSSAVVCAIRYLEPDIPIHTFSYIASDDLNEEPWVDRVNDHVGAIPHKITFSIDDLANDLDNLIRAQAEPFSGTSIYAQYKVFQLAKECGITVTLDGQGADEMLAGYNGYPGPRLRSLVESGRLSSAVTLLNGWVKWPRRNRSKALKGLFSELTKGKAYFLLRLINGTSSVPIWINRRALKRDGIRLFPIRTRPTTTKRGRRLVAELAHALTCSGLPVLLRYADRNSMAFSIESRVPFLTTPFVDLLLSMPEHFLLSRKGETKSVFRAAMRGIVPDQILDRKDKIGFATPERDLLMSHPELIRKWLDIDLELEFLDQNKIRSEVEDVIEGNKKFSPQVWRWINFIRWYQINFL